MDELMELREGWGLPDPPSPASSAAARNALLARAAGPAGAGAGAAGAGARPAVPAGGGQARGRGRAGRPRRRRLGWLAGGAGLAAAAAVAAAAVMAGAPQTAATRGGGHAAASGPAAVSHLSARQILLDAATTAAARPAGSGRYWRLTTVVPGPPRPTTLQTWQTHTGVEYSLAPDGREVYRPSLDCDFSVGGRWLTYGQLRSLPTSPASLTAWLAWSVSRNGWQPASPCASGQAAPRPEWAKNPDPAGALAMELANLLYQVPAPPAVRAAAFRALASMPDVRKLGDAEGGVVLAVHVPKVPAGKFPSGTAPRGDNGVITLVVDPATSLLRAESNYQGTVRILQAGWTDRMPPVVTVGQAFAPKPGARPGPANG